MIRKIKSVPNNCSSCTLSISRIQVVYPDIVINSKDNITILIIGEAPGANEDREGIPFVGASGKILRKELVTLPGTVVITNSVKCRPPKNRNPSKAEKEACRPFLDQEIDFYKADFIILVGRIASSLFISNKDLKNFTDLSGSKVNKNIIPVLHPASTMYNAKKNKPIWIESWAKIRLYIKEKYPNASFPVTEKPIKNKSIQSKSLSSWM